MKYFLLLSGLLTFLYSSPISAETTENSTQDEENSKLQVSFSAAVSSRYVWRGIRLTDDPVFQPSANLEISNFSFNVWTNMDLGDANGKQFRVSEVDYTIAYSFGFKSLNCTLGSMSYTYPNTEDVSTTELFFETGLEAFLQPTLCIYRDVDEVKGSYVSLSLGHGLALDFLKTTLDCSSSLGWGSSNQNAYYYEVENRSFTDIGFSIAAPFTYRDRLTFTPSISYSSLLGGQLRKSQEHDDHLFFGLSLSCDM